MKQRTTRILDEAADTVHGDRAAQYGPPLINHTRTAALWSAYLDTMISARDVCMLNILQKVSRDRHFAKRDNALDIAGYAENAELVRSDEIDLGHGRTVPVRPTQPGEEIRYQPRHEA